MSGYSVTEVTRAFNDTLERFPEAGAILAFMFKRLNEDEFADRKFSAYRGSKAPEESAR